jgi:hypothetical protein
MSKVYFWTDFCQIHFQGGRPALIWTSKSWDYLLFLQEQIKDIIIIVTIWNLNELPVCWDKVWDTRHHQRQVNHYH